MIQEAPSDRVVPMAPGCRRFLGHARTVRFLTDLGGLTGRLANAGPIVRVKAGPLTGYVVNDASLIRQAARDEEAFGPWGAVPQMRALTEGGMVSAEGPAHREQRTEAKSALSVHQPADFARSVHDVTQGLLSALPADRPIDMTHEMTRLGYGLAVGCVLRAEAPPEALTALALARPALSRWGTAMFLLSQFPWLPALRPRGSRRALALVEDVSRELVARHRPTPDGRDLMSALKHAPQEHADVAWHKVRTLLSSAGETTSSTLAWACYELGRHPHHQQALQEEADTLAADRFGLCTDEVLLPRAAAFVKEVIRLHSPPVLVRRTRRQTSLGGFRLPARATVFLHVGALDRNPAHYPQPDTFDPLRWMPGTERPAPSTTLLPYGVGPRYCPGAAMADVMLPVALATLVASRTVDMAQPVRQVRAGIELVATPRGLIMTAVPRKPCRSRPSTVPGHQPFQGARATTPSPGRTSP
ncbi:cytochrome P450 [Streptomyces sp. NPDC054864]